MTFEERHAEVDADPVVELMRRRQSWAWAPDAKDGHIVPLATIDAAIAELLRYRIEAKLAGAKELAEKFYDL